MKIKNLLLLCYAINFYNCYSMNANRLLKPLRKKIDNYLQLKYSRLRNLDFKLIDKAKNSARNKSFFYKNLPIKLALLSGTGLTGYWYKNKKPAECSASQIFLAIAHNENLSHQDIVSTAEKIISLCEKSPSSITIDLLNHDIWLNRDFTNTIFKNSVARDLLINVLKKHAAQNPDIFVKLCARLFGNEQLFDPDKQPVITNIPAILDWHLFNNNFSITFIKNASEIGSALINYIQSQPNFALEMPWARGFINQFSQQEDGFLIKFFNQIYSQIQDMDIKLSVEKLNKLKNLSYLACMGLEKKAPDISNISEKIIDTAFEYFLKSEKLEHDSEEEYMFCHSTYTNLLAQLAKTDNKSKYLNFLIAYCRKHDKIIDDIITLFDNVDANLSHSKKHFNAYLLKFLSNFSIYQHKNVYSPLLAQTLKSMIENEIHLREKNYNVFYHAQLNNLIFFEQLTTFIYSKTRQKQLENFLLLHIREPLDQKQDEVLRNAILKGKTSHEEHRSRILFMNPSIFGNITNLGSHSVFYAGTNWNVHPPTINAEDIFKWYNIESIYNKYADEIKALATESENLSSHGTFIQIAVPDYALNSSVYLSTSGGTPQKADIIDNGETKSTTNTLEILKAYYTNPLKVRYGLEFALNTSRTYLKSDHFEFCATMTHDEKGWLNPESGIHMFIHRPVEIEKLQVFEAKQKDLFERIGNDIDTQKYFFNK